MQASPPASVVNEKRALRRAMADRRNALPPDERRERARAAVDRLLGLPELAQPQVVAAFVSMRAELDPCDALTALRGRGITVALPRVGQGSPRLSFHHLPDDGALVPGAYGVAEPAASCPAVPLEALDVVLTPGLAFDLRGGRVGYGGGYYDELTRHLRPVGRACFIGFAYDFQLIDACPVSDGDELIDLVVTDQRVLRFRSELPELPEIAS